MRLVNLTLLIATPIAQTCLALLLLRRKAARRFRWFFIYTVFSIAAALARSLVKANTWNYFYVYWTAEAFYAVFGFLAIQEAFYWVFRYFYQWWWWFKFVLPGIGLTALGLAIIKGFLFPPIQAPKALAIIFVTELAVRCLQGGIFALFVALVKFHALPARTYAFGITLGFAISSFGILLTVLWRSEYGTNFARLLEVTPSVTYILAVAVWLAFFARPELPDRLADDITSTQIVETLQQYTKVFKDFLKRCSLTAS